MARVISADWQQLYHHPIHWLETFIDPARFRGTCYRAANWLYLGRSTGRRRPKPRPPIFQAMIQTAAQGTLLHTDDTTMRVQSLQREIAQAGDQAERTGIFTTGLIAKLGTGQRVALYFTGSRHAGENLDHVLQHRAAGLPPPLHMCDGLSRNGSKEFETILCNCAAHGRRQFTDVREAFPVECRQVIEEWGLVYHHDAQARAEQLSDEQRLRFHQEHSQPVMDRLQQWMKDPIEQKRVEPNSGLGQAIHYMLKRWEPLTRFLKIYGAQQNGAGSARIDGASGWAAGSGVLLSKGARAVASDAVAPNKNPRPTLSTHPCRSGRTRTFNIALAF